MIQELIEKKNLSIHSLSKKTGIPYTTLYEYVTGKKDYAQFPIASFLKVANALDMTVEELYRNWCPAKKTDLSGCMYLPPDTEVLYRLFRHKKDYILYIYYDGNWFSYRSRWPKGIPDGNKRELVICDYINMTANRLYYRLWAKDHGSELLFDA